MPTRNHRGGDIADQLLDSIQAGLNAFGQQRNLKPLAWFLACGHAVSLIGSANDAMYHPSECRTIVGAWAHALGLPRIETSLGILEFSGRVGPYHVTVWTITDPTEFYPADVLTNATPDSARD
jgi:hypothetical protein